MCIPGWISQASYPFCYPKKSQNSLPATNDSFTGECQVQKALPDFKWKGILQCVAINNQSNIIFLAQWLPQTGTMLSQRSSCRLKKKQKEKVSSWYKESAFKLEQGISDRAAEHSTHAPKLALTWAKVYLQQKYWLVSQISKSCLCLPRNTSCFRADSSIFTTQSCMMDVPKAIVIQPSQL